MNISLRNLPPEVQKAIEETSRREGISLSEATIRLLQASLRKPGSNTAIDEFCGTWSKAEADRFDAALRRMRKVDLADWEMPLLNAARHLGVFGASDGWRAGRSPRRTAQRLPGRNPARRE